MKHKSIIHWALQKGSTATTYAGALRYLRSHLSLDNPLTWAGLNSVEHYTGTQQKYSDYVNHNPAGRTAWEAKHEYYERRAEKCRERFGYIALDDAEAWAEELTQPLLDHAENGLSGSCWPYRRSKSKWAGGNHEVRVHLADRPYVGSGSQKVWSDNGKWSGTDSYAHLSVTRRALHYFPELRAAGLIVLDANQLGPREYEMTWCEQSTGVSLKAATGYYIRGRHVPVTNIDVARRAAARMRHSAAEAERTRRTRERIEKLTAIRYQELLKRTWVTMDDSIQVGNCEAASELVRNQVAAAIGASGEFAARADVLLAIRDDHYSRRAIARAMQRVQP